jgi:hypothetical protein
VNDGALFGPKPVFDRWVAAQLALLLAMTGALLAGAGWHGGFGARRRCPANCRRCSGSA